MSRRSVRCTVGKCEGEAVCEIAWRGNGLQPSCAAHYAWASRLALGVFGFAVRREPLRAEPRGMGR